MMVMIQQQPKAARWDKPTDNIKSVTLPTGVTLPYVEQGDPDGVPVVLLHGDADHPATGYRPHEFAADAAAFIDTLGLRPVVIAGTSMGSIVAQRFAIDYAERTLGLVLAAVATTWRTPAALALWDIVSTLEDPIDPGFVRDFQESTLAQPVPPALLDSVVQESLKVPARVWRAALREAHLEADIAGELDAITAPTQIVWGHRDAIHSPSEQEALVGAIAGAQLVVYPAAGHALHWEEPERFAADLVAFVERLSN